MIIQICDQCGKEIPNSLKPNKLSSNEKGFGEVCNTCESSLINSIKAAWALNKKEREGSAVEAEDLEETKEVVEDGNTEGKAVSSSD